MGRLVSLSGWDLSELTIAKQRGNGQRGRLAGEKDDTLGLRAADSEVQGTQLDGQTAPEEAELGTGKGLRSGTVPLRDCRAREIADVGLSDCLKNPKMPKCSLTHQEKIYDLELLVVIHYTAT